MLMGEIYGYNTRLNIGTKRRVEQYWELVGDWGRALRDVRALVACYKQSSVVYKVMV